MKQVLVKRVFVLWESDRRTRADRRAALESAIPALLSQRADALSVLIADEHAAVRSPNPFPLTGRKPVALVNLWGDQPDADVCALLTAQGFEVAGYRVEESVYRDYGDNEHAAPRDWPDGVRSPGVTAVTFMERPARLSEEAWVARWHGRISPVSEAIQPRTRYVRNRVTAPIGEAPPFAGIVEEAFPSPRHIERPMLFYGATGPISLVVNVLRILVAVTSFLTLWRIQTVVMSEYFIRTPAP